MAEDLLERVKREIRERKRAAQAAHEETQRLEQALAALSAPRTGDPAPDAARTRSRSAQLRPSRRRRAPAGANRAAILAVVRERPGVTAAEIAQTTGIARATVYSTIARLADTGAVERTEPPSGSVGFRAAPEPDASAPLPAGASGQAAPGDEPA